MISEISVKAKPQNKRAHKISATCLAFAAILFVTRFFIDRYEGIVDLFTIGFITAAVFLYTKYVSNVYYYETMITSEGVPMFLVKRMTGKRASLLFCVHLYEILSIKKETRAEFKSHKTPAGTVKYLYTPTLFPENVYRIQTRGAYERAEVVIECSDEFAAQLLEWAREAKTEYLSED